MEGMQKITDNFYVDKTKKLGKGNFGTVYKGYHLSENRIIAAKFIDKKVLQKSPDYERQIIVMEELAKVRHPNIMGYYGYQKNNDGLYCFIQFCTGGSLKEMSSTRISQLKVLTLFRQLLDAMAYINSLNKVHRDLKPDNILLDQNKEVKIADFGLARDVNVLMTKGACTPLYAAPEVFNLQNYNQKCDVWSAGMILYEMLTGKQFFAHVKTKAQLSQQLSRFSTGRKIGYSSSLHSKWQYITSYMLTYDKEKRPSFATLLTEFDKWQVQIETDLNNKYGYEPQSLDDGLRITKTISPYQAKMGKAEKVDLLKKLRQERSYTNLMSLRKYLTFYRMKSDFFNKLIKQFTTNAYSSLKNVHKYILMFLSASCYVSRLEQNLQQIKKGKISTPDGPISKDDVQPVHQGEFREVLKQFETKHQSSIAKFKGVIQKQIISKILGSYMKRQEQKKILQATSNVLKLIEAANQGKFTSEQEYIALFIKMINSNQVYVSLKQIDGYPDLDIKTYMFMRIIGNMDTVFASQNYHNDDYMKMKKQQIQNFNKKEAIQFIKDINSK